jgi:hypothetical protein
LFTQADDRVGGVEWMRAVCEEKSNSKMNIDIRPQSLLLR